MRTRSHLLPLLLGLVFANVACDQTAANELAAARNDLNTARSELERAETLLTAAREDLEKARAECTQASQKSADLSALRAQARAAIDPDHNPDPALTDPFAATSPMANADTAIRCEVAEQCTIDRAFFEGLMENPESLVQQARIIPAVEAGKTVGIKLYGIRPNSLPKLLGLRNGDLVRAVNDLPFDNMDALLSAYSELRKLDTFVLEITRKGQPVRLTIRIVDGAAK